MGGGGFVSGIITSATVPNLVYARTDVGGAYRWQEPTQSWVPLTDWASEDQTGFLGVESLAIDPSEPNRLYMLVGINYFNGGKTAILSSTDFGQSFSVHEVTPQFQAHGNGMGRQSGERLAVDPNDGSTLFTGTRDDGLFVSRDRGASWAPVNSLGVTTTPNGNGVNFVLFDAASGTPGSATPVIYVGVSRALESNLFVSRDAGASWTPIAGEPTALAPQHAVLRNGSLHVTYANGAGPNGTQTPDGSMTIGEVWKLDIGSGAWTDISPLRGAETRAFSGISVAADDPQRLLVSTVNTYLQQPWGYGDRIFLSNDGGASWTDLIGSGSVQMNTGGSAWIEGQAIHWAGSIEIDPFNSQRAFVSSGNGVFMTDDLGAPASTWTFATNGLEETVPTDAVSIPGGPLVSTILDYDGFVHTDLTLSPATGRHKPSINSTAGLALAPGNPRVLARVGTALYLSRDGAVTWTLIPRPTVETGGRLSLSADGSVLLWAPRAGVQRTADSGVTWTPVTALAFTTHPAADAVNPSKFYAYNGTTGQFFASTDAGQTFASRATLATGGATRIRPVPGVEGEVWVALYGGGLARTTNSGATFQNVAGVSRCGAVGFGAPAPNHTFPAVYIWGAPGTEPMGVYRSDDAGASWLRVNDDNHQYGGPANGQFVFGDANVYGRVYLSSAGRGIAYGEPAEVPAP
jgi:xyloglucan-specific exo-beta-1,4-glucanase